MSATRVVVLGMHRSGTSLVAGLLHRAGVYMGTYFRAPDAANPSGYFEDIVWRNVNKTILNCAGGTWWQPPPQERICLAAAHIWPLVAALVEDRDTSSLWGFKDPRTCLTLRVLAPLLEPFRIIYVEREEEQVIESLKRRAELRGYEEPDRHWRALCEHYRLQAEEAMADRPVLRVRFEEVTSRERSGDVLHALAGFVGIEEGRLRDAAEGFIRYRS